MTTARILAALLAVVVVSATAGFWYMLAVPGRSWVGPSPPLDAAGQDLARRLESHVRAIASEPHNIAHYPALERAADHIERALSENGYAVERQVFEVDGRSVRNIEVAIEPAGRDLHAPTFVIGAHYDSAGTAPGANDNGTGTAAVIELARLLRQLNPKKIRIRLVLFVNEEPPYFQTNDMGSWRYAKRLAERGEAVSGMLSLETLGAFSSVPGSQQYPFWFNTVLPDKADFVAFVAMPGSRTFLHDVLRRFRAHAKVPSIGGVAPGLIPGIGWSDHWSFAEFGFPAVMVTDTALFRYPHYHTTGDTADKVDFAMLARITKALEHTIRDLARGD